MNLTPTELQRLTIFTAAEIEINAGRERVSVDVLNTGDRNVFADGKLLKVEPATRAPPGRKYMLR
jgi:urease beta subunit